MTPTLFIIRSPDGTPEAIHQRTDTPEGKRFAWWALGPDGDPTPSLGGRPVAALPLYGAQHAAKWDRSRKVFVVEGESDATVLLKANYRAVGTVGGAGVIPGDGALAVLIGLHLVLWADNDDGGRRLMQGIAQRLRNAAASLQWVEWPDAPAGGGAADYLTAGLAIEDLNLVDVPPIEPTPAELIQFADHEARRRRRPSRSPRQASPIEQFNASVGVTEVLRRDYGLTVTPGRSVRCPLHDDRSPSLKVMADDRRVYCHAPSCWAHGSGQGRDAWDLAHQADVAVAR